VHRLHSPFDNAAAISRDLDGVDYVCSDYGCADRLFSEYPIALYIMLCKLHAHFPDPVLRQNINGFEVVDSPG
jgi:hypothetical protein